MPPLADYHVPTLPSSPLSGCQTPPKGRPLVPDDEQHGIHLPNAAQPAPLDVVSSAPARFASSAANGGFSAAPCTQPRTDTGSGLNGPLIGACRAALCTFRLGQLIDDVRGVSYLADQIRRGLQIRIDLVQHTEVAMYAATRPRLITRPAVRLPDLQPTASTADPLKGPRSETHSPLLRPVSRPEASNQWRRPTVLRCTGS